MDREQQRRRITALQRSIIGGATVATLSIAGALGLTAAHGAADAGNAVDQGAANGANSWGHADGSALTGGSGPSHATTSGS